MIRARLYVSREGRYTGYTVTGHAGWAEEGRDIVCSAVSVLSIVCCNALESAAGIRPEAEMDKGSLRVKLPRDSGHDAQVVLGVFRQGMKDLSQQYPDFIAYEEIDMEE
jgi:hypothetical protein